eukprot:scaffold76416_cov50-Attheya_sp.AAC.4
MRTCPALTEKDRILDCSSPATSGTSFIRAMTIPKTPKKSDDRAHLRLFLRQVSTVTAAAEFRAAAVVL